jgi:hypothetical protein
MIYRLTYQTEWGLITITSVIESDMTQRVDQRPSLSLDH